MARKSRKQIAVEEPVIESVSSEVFSTAIYARLSVIHIGIYQIQVGTLCNVRLANLNLICDDIHLFRLAV